jgi:TolB protein
VSADGRRLCYTTSSINPDLFVRNLQTGSEQRLGGEREEFSPVFSPDGRSVVFVSDRRAGRFELWSQPLGSGLTNNTPVRLTDHPGSASQPAFSPDGRWIAYHRVLDAQRDVWIVPAGGGAASRFTDHTGADIHADWSPDGTEIAFISDREGSEQIWRAPVREGRPIGPARRLTSLSDVPSSPTWSPDGLWIAFVAHVEGQGQEVWITKADGSGAPRQLTSGAQAGRAVWNRSTGALWASGFWGGQWVTLARVDADGGDAAPLRPRIVLSRSPGYVDFDVSADGRSVAFSREERRGDIWVFEANGTPY